MTSSIHGQCLSMECSGYWRVGGKTCKTVACHSGKGNNRISGVLFAEVKLSIETISKLLYGSRAVAVWKISELSSFDACTWTQSGIPTTTLTTLTFKGVFKTESISLYLSFFYFFLSLFPLSYHLYFLPVFSFISSSSFLFFTRSVCISFFPFPHLSLSLSPRQTMAPFVSPTCKAIFTNWHLQSASSLL